MMNRRFSSRMLASALICAWACGCGGAGPLTIKKNSKIVGPWCAAKQRVQIGDRVVGQIHDGNKHKIFLVDADGKEHDPDMIAERAWRFLERTGDAKRLQAAFAKDGYYPKMTVIAINPMVVLVEPYWNPDLRQRVGPSLQRYHWLSIISSQHYPPGYHAEMRWFSPDLNKGLMKLTFSARDEAEIPLLHGKLKIRKKGGACETERE